MQLYDYQQDSVEGLREGFKAGHRCQMLYGATGSGKTIISAHIIKNAVMLGNYVVFIVDRICLVEQAAATFRKLGLTVGILQGSNTDIPNDWEVIVATVQTLKHRGMPERTALALIDEAHILHKAHQVVMDSKLLFIGLSATPIRPDLGEYFTNLVCGPSVRELTEQGKLVPLKAYCPKQERMADILKDVKVARGDYVEKELSQAMNTTELVGDLVDTWLDKAGGKRTLCFAVDIAHSKRITADFVDAGIDAEHMDATTKYEERQEILQRFKDGETRVLSSVNVLGVGFDAPWAEVAIMARPTQSEALYMQYAGRILRPFEGKDYALLLDHAGNTLKFGLPMDFKVGALGRGPHQTGGKSMLVCGNCGYAMTSKVCPECGTERELSEVEIAELSGELVPFADDIEEKYFRMLKYIAIKRGYSSNWPWLSFKDRFGYKPSWEIQQMEPMEPNESVMRYDASERKKWRQKREAIEAQSV